MDLKSLLRSQWDRVGAAALIVFGGVVLLLGWVGVSGTVYPAEQLPYIVSGGLVGVALVGLGGMLWLSADVRDEWSELHEIARLLGADEAEGAGERVLAGMEDVGSQTSEADNGSSGGRVRRRPVTN